MSIVLEFTHRIQTDKLFSLMNAVSSYSRYEGTQKNTLVPPRNPLYYNCTKPMINIYPVTEWYSVIMRRTVNSYRECKGPP